MNEILSIRGARNIAANIMVLIGTVGGFWLLSLGAWMYALDYFFGTGFSGDTALGVVSTWCLTLCCTTVGKIIAPRLAELLKTAGAGGELATLPFYMLWQMGLLSVFLGLSFSLETYGKLMAISVGMIVLVGIIGGISAALIIWLKKH